MASLQILNPIFSSISIFPGKSDFKKKILSFNTCRSFKCFHSQRCRIYCATQEGDNKSNNDEPTESLFMKELKRRGITSTTLDGKKTNVGLNEDIKIGEERPSNFSTRNVVSTQYEKSLYNQSMELNSEGLEGQGRVPRPKLLLTIGVSFFLGFWPLILSTIAFFAVVCLCFGPSFIHDGNTTAPQYMDRPL